MNKPVLRRSPLDNKLYLVFDNSHDCMEYLEWSMSIDPDYFPAATKIVFDAVRQGQLSSFGAPDNAIELNI